jgi:hypothetical protein
MFTRPCHYHVPSYSEIPEFNVLFIDRLGFNKTIDLLYDYEKGLKNIVRLQLAIMEESSSEPEVFYSFVFCKLGLRLETKKNKSIDKELSNS